MQYFKKPGRGEVIVTTSVFLWILIANIAAVVLGLHSWPMFFVTIFFFLLHADLKQIPCIFAGGTLGLASALFLAYGLKALAPSAGELGAFVILITIVLGVIIIGGTVFPVACNNIAFAYLTTAAINIGDITARSILRDLLMLFIGGGVILGGALLFARAGGKLAAPKASPEKTRQ